MNKAIIYSQNLVASKYNQFTERSQHDAHEFMSFLLDGLHEVCNSVYICMCVCVFVCVCLCVCYVCAVCQSLCAC